MPNIDKPRDAAAIAATVTPLPPLRSVDGGALCLQVRKIGNGIQLRAELRSADASPLAVTLPLLTPGVAMQLARALIETASGEDFDVSQYGFRGQ